MQTNDNPCCHHRRRVGTLALTDGFKLTFFDRPGGLVALKTLREASTADRPIEAYLFEAYAHFRLVISREVLIVFLVKLISAERSTTARINRQS